MRCRIAPMLTLLLLPLRTVAPAIGQDSNITLPIDTIEHRLAEAPFDVVERAGSRFEGDRTQRVMLTFADGLPIMVKWATAPRGGEAFNNQPRYEVAAYRLQRLFLEDPELVVPPTVVRAVPLPWYRQLDTGAYATFAGVDAVLVVLQYWLSDVTNRGVYDEARLTVDSAYAHQFANLNILTYLIRHSDSNTGNVLISNDSLRPRLFTVDNGVAFASPPSDRGLQWRSLRVRRLPRVTVERLRLLTRADLDRELGVIAQFEERDGQLVAVPPTENLGRGSGVRRRGRVLQLGLTSTEIGGVHNRLQGLLTRVDRGEIQTF